MSFCYAIVESPDSLLLIDPRAGTHQRIGRAQLAEALRPMAALGYPTPDIDSLSMADVAVRLSGAMALKQEQAEKLVRKIEEIADFSANSGGTLRACLTIPEPTLNLIIRRGREADDRDLPTA